MIASLKNGKIVDLRKLAQRKYRRRFNRFAVEGLQLLTLAIEAGHTPLEVFYCDAHFAGETAPRLLKSWQETGVPTYAVTHQVMAALSERDAPQGLIATFPRHQSDLPTILNACPTPEPALLLVVDRLQDPGNLGTLIRTADAVGAAGIVLITPCVDPFDPKTVRGSMGSIFALPVVTIDEPAKLFATLYNRDFALVGADGYQGHVPWQHDTALKGRVALVLGNEARGLSDDLRPLLTAWVRLPLRGAAESLNVAVAGGVLLYQWLAKNFPNR